MKKKFSICFIVLSLCIVSLRSTAQDVRDAGGSADGSGPQPCPISFKRNNGNGKGVCGGDAQIRVSFSELPASVPQLTAIYYTNKNSGIQTRVNSIELPVDGDIIDKTKPYVSYCLTGILPAPGNSQGNIPPAVKLVLEFKYPSGQVCTTESEE